MKISTHFSYEEFVVSADHPEIATEIYLTHLEKERVRCFVLYLLQPMRYEIEEPIHILSGKRSAELNTLVGGYPYSDHLFKPQTKSIAADITCKNIMKAYTYLLNNKSLYKMVYMNMAKNFIHISGLDNISAHSVENIYRGKISII